MSEGPGLNENRELLSQKGSVAEHRDAVVAFSRMCTVVLAIELLEDVEQISAGSDSPSPRQAMYPYRCRHFSRASATPNARMWRR